MNTGDSLLSALSALSAPVEPISAFYGQDGQEVFGQQFWHGPFQR
jgi:hypothetical protein